MPRFSVVVPLYNKGAYVRRCIESLFAQTLEDFEVIIVDDGSTDDGPEWVRSLTDPRILLVQQENLGPGAARNTGLALARSSHVAFLDADDEWLRDFLAVLDRLTRAFPAAVLFGTAHRRELGAVSVKVGIPGLGRDWEGVLSGYFELAAAGVNVISASSACVNRDVLLAMGGFPGQVRYGEDPFTWTRLALAGPIAFSNRVCAVVHRDDPESATRTPRVLTVPDWSELGPLTGAAGNYVERARFAPAKMCVLCGLRREALSLIPRVRSRLGLMRALVIVACSLVPCRLLRLLFALRIKARYSAWRTV